MVQELCRVSGDGTHAAELQNGSELENDLERMA